MQVASQEGGFEQLLASAPPTIVVASFRRSGTHLTIDSILNNAAGVHPAYVTLETLNPDHGRHVPGTALLQQLAAAGQNSVIVKTHLGPPADDAREAWHDQADALIARSTIIYVVRDPRDVMVSLQKFICSHTPAYRDKTLSQHLELQLPQWRDHVAYWHARNVPIIRFEDWARSYGTTLTRCLRDAGLQRKQGPIVQLYHYKQKQKQAEKWRSIPVLGRLFKRTETRATTTAKLLGSGNVGDWKKIFSADDRARVVDVCGDWLDALGYAR